MKKQILTLSLAAISVVSFGQITLVNETNGSVITPGSSFTVNGTASETDLHYDLIKVVNNTGGTTKLNMRRYEISAPAGTKNYFCWYVCLGEVYQGQTPVYNHGTGPLMNVNNGDTLDLFSGHHKPMGLPGAATYRFVVYDINDTNDSTWFDIMFDVSVGIEEFNKVEQFRVFPNPANSIVKLDYEFSNTNASEKHLIINDILGNKVKDIILAQDKGLVTLDVHSLNQGIYFYSLAMDGKAVETKRLVISR